jgi:hypothetical protein
MRHLENSYFPRGVQVWAILASPYGQNWELSGGTDRSPATMSDFAWYSRTYKVSYPMLIDPNFATVNRYGANGYPTLYVIDRAGRVQYAGSGRTPYTVLATQVDKALHSKAT